MRTSESKFILITLKIHNCWQGCYIIGLNKYLITQQLQLCLLIIINGNKNYTLIRKQSFSNLQPLTHKREPFAMAETIF